MQLPLHRAMAEQVRPPASRAPATALAGLGRLAGADRPAAVGRLARAGPKASGRNGVSAVLGRLLASDTEHSHGLEAERQPLATVAGADVESGEFADALEPVPDGVAVHEERL